MLVPSTKKLRNDKYENRHRNKLYYYYYYINAVCDETWASAMVGIAQRASFANKLKQTKYIYLCVWKNQTLKRQRQKCADLQ